MIDQETLTKLRAMRLSGMAECFDSLAVNSDQARLSTPEIVRLAIDWEWERRQNSKLSRLRKRAHLAQPNADIADVQTLPGRRLDNEMISRLAIGTYLVKHQDIILQGPTGVGKTYIACALANKACQQYHSVRYLSAAELFDELATGERSGRKTAILDSLVRVDLLVIDDWFLTAPSQEQARNLHVLVDRRHKQTSTIYCTQLGTAQWHERFQEKILADAVIDRITTNAHTIHLEADDSLRRHYNQID